MNPEEARQVIQVLARGIDPETGELLPPDNPLHGANVIRALFVATEALDRAARRGSQAPSQAGKPWPVEEDDRLLEAFDAGTPIAELARTHERSRGAITSRLTRLGRLQLATQASPPVTRPTGEARAEAREERPLEASPQA